MALLEEVLEEGAQHILQLVAVLHHLLGECFQELARVTKHLLQILFLTLHHLLRLLLFRKSWIWHRELGNWHLVPLVHLRHEHEPWKVPALAIADVVTEIPRDRLPCDGISFPVGRIGYLAENLEALSPNSKVIHASFCLQLVNGLPVLHCHFSSIFFGLHCKLSLGLEVPNFLGSVSCERLTA